jgi:PGF-pre-PGF domain-containing protein
MLWLAAPAEAAITITSAQIVDVSGNVTNLNHDTQTQSYADGSLENPNVFIKICAGPGELINKFAGILYKVGNSIVDLEVLPAKITSVDGSNCATLDIDINFFKARYPALPVVVVGDDATFTNPVYQALGYTDGYLLGNYTFTATEINSTAVSVTVTGAKDESAAAITTNKPYILAGLQTPGGAVLDSGQTQLNQAVTLAWDGDSTDFVNINGMLFLLFPPAPAPPSEITGAVFGAVSGWNCTWTSTYDETAQPGNPIDLIYYHDCTLLREVSIDVSSIVIGARIKTLGNYTVISPPPPNVPTGYVFGYFAFEHNIPAEKFNKITIQFKVPKADLNAKGFQTSDITLRKFTNSSWTVLPAKLVSEDNDYYYFESAPNTLSLFAIVAEHVGAVPAPIPTPIPTPPTPAVVTPAFPIIPIALTVLLMLVIIAAGYSWYMRRPSAITMPILAPPPQAVPLEMAQLQRRIAEIKRALERPVSKQAPGIQRVSKIRKGARKEVVRPKAKPTKRVRPAKKTGEKKFYKALGGVEKALR